MLSGAQVAVIAVVLVALVVVVLYFARRSDRFGGCGSSASWEGCGIAA